MSRLKPESPLISSPTIPGTSGVEGYLRPLRPCVHRAFLDALGKPHPFHLRATSNCGPCGRWYSLSPFCKRVYRVDRVQDLPRIVERAFRDAVSGRPGPVWISRWIFSADLPVMDVSASSDRCFKAPRSTRPWRNGSPGLSKLAETAVVCGGGVVTRATAGIEL